MGEGANFEPRAGRYLALLRPCAKITISHQKQILAKLVDLPTPLTPQKVTTNGFPAFLDETMSRRMSIRRFGVNKANNDSVKTSFTVR